MQKQFIFLGLIVGSMVGGYAPMLFGAGLFSVTSIITSTIGGFLGIYIGYKIGQNF
jgi:phage tail tape-measure protein